MPATSRAAHAPGTGSVVGDAGAHPPVTEDAGAFVLEERRSAYHDAGNVAAVADARWVGDVAELGRSPASPMLT